MSNELLEKVMVEKTFQKTYANLREGKSVKEDKRILRHEGLGFEKTVYPVYFVTLSEPLILQGKTKIIY